MFFFTKISLNFVRNQIIELFLILYNFVETKIASNTYELSYFQIERIRLAKEQFQNGKSVVNKNVIRKIEKSNENI